MSSSRIRTHCPTCQIQYVEGAQECEHCGRVRDLKSEKEIVAEKINPLVLGLSGGILLLLGAVVALVFTMNRTSPVATAPITTAMPTIAPATPIPTPFPASTSTPSPSPPPTPEREETVIDPVPATTLEPKIKVDPDETTTDFAGWRRFRSEILGVRISAPYSWAVTRGTREDETYISIRRSETPPISLKLTRNPSYSFDTQERDKRAEFGRKYRRIGRNSDRQFHGIAAESWAFNEPSDTGIQKRILKFQFDRNGSRWEFAIVAPASEYEDYQEDFNQIIDRIEFD